MHISLIAALNPQHVIGDGDGLLWHLPDDFKHFKALTLNKPVVMGRKTFDSIGKPLPGRHNIVLTHSTDWRAPGVTRAHTLDEVLALADTCQASELMVIGGAAVYALFLPLAHHLYLTWVDYPDQGRTRFPDVDWNDWQLTDETEHPVDDKHRYRFRFTHYQRQRPLPPAKVAP